jgi:hypothetical protein
VLLSKLYTPGSACSSRNWQSPEGFSYVLFRVEPDELHYDSPMREGAGRGVVDPRAEAVYARFKRAVADVLGTGDPSS